VVPGLVRAADVVKVSSAKTVNGQSLAVKTNAEGVTIDNARVVKADIECTNGVVHVIDSVVLPRNL
jgi:uncharacterized surface protein with fasciclin (FAS1) repeats